MKALLTFFACSALIMAQDPGKIPLNGAVSSVTGAGVPSSSTCSALNQVGSFYQRTDAASTSSSFYVCSNTGASTYGWVLQGVGNATRLSPVAPYFTQYLSNLLGNKQPTSGQTPTIIQETSSSITNSNIYYMVNSGTVDQTHFRYVGSNPFATTVFGQPGIAVGDNHADEIYSAGNPQVEFMADTQNLEICQQGNGQGMRVLVDGVEVLNKTSVPTTGTAQAGATSTITLATGASASNGFYNTYWINITSGTGSGQLRQITGYVGSTKVATVNQAWATVPDATSVYEIGLTTYTLANLPNDGGVYYTKLSFPTRAVRRFMVQTGVNIYSVGVDSSGVITLPIPITATRAFVIGDSFAEGTGALPYQGFVNILCAMLGWEAWDVGFGGTGFIATDGGIRKNYIDRSAPAYNSWQLVSSFTGTGTFQLTQNGVSTSAIATNASQATVQAAVNAAFGSPSFTVYPSQFYFWVLCGQGTYGVTAAPLTISVSGVTGTASTVRYAGDILPYVPLDPSGNPKPFVILVEGSGNDDGQGSALTTAATTLYSALVAKFPSAVIFTTGRWMNMGPEGSGQITTNSELLTASASLPNINNASPFIPIFNASNGVGYLNGSTNVTSPSGVAGVNTDWLVLSDGTHPNGLAGHYNLALVIAEGIMNIIGK